MSLDRHILRFLNVMIWSFDNSCNLSIICSFNSYCSKSLSMHYTASQFVIVNFLILMYCMIIM